MRVPLEVHRVGGRWLEIAHVTNGANSKRILREYLALQYLGTDNF